MLWLAAQPVWPILWITFYKDQQEHISPALHSHSVQWYSFNPFYGKLSDYYSMTKSMELLVTKLSILRVKFPQKAFGGCRSECKLFPGGGGTYVKTYVTMCDQRIFKQTHIYEVHGCRIYLPECWKSTLFWVFLATHGTTFSMSGPSGKFFRKHASSLHGLRPTVHSSSKHSKVIIF